MMATLKNEENKRNYNTGSSIGVGYAIPYFDIHSLFSLATITYNRSVGLGYTNMYKV